MLTGPVGLGDGVVDVLEISVVEDCCVLEAGMMLLEASVVDGSCVVLKAGVEDWLLEVDVVSVGTEMAS